MVCRVCEYVCVFDGVCGMGVLIVSAWVSMSECVCVCVCTCVWWCVCVCFCGCSLSLLCSFCALKQKCWGSTSPLRSAVMATLSACLCCWSPSLPIWTDCLSFSFVLLRRYVGTCTTERLLLAHVMSLSICHSDGVSVYSLTNVDCRCWDIFCLFWLGRGYLFFPVVICSFM